MNNLKIFSTNLSDGAFSSSVKFYPKEYTNEMIVKEYHKRVVDISKKYDFDPLRLIKVAQKGVNKSSIHEDGKHILITNELVEELFKDYKYLVDTELFCDIFVMKSDVKDTVIGVPGADCPPIVAFSKDKEIVSIAHCGGSYIDRYLPVNVVDALQKEKKVLDEDIKVYVGPCIGKESYIYDRYPKWATNSDIWNDAIVKDDDNNYYIDLRYAIKKQLLKRNIKEENIIFNPIDTYENENYPSNRALSQGEEKKIGQMFTGAFYRKKNR